MQERVEEVVARLTAFEGVTLAFPESVSYHEVTLSLPVLSLSCWTRRMLSESLRERMFPIAFREAGTCSSFPSPIVRKIWMLWSRCSALALVHPVRPGVAVGLSLEARDLRTDAPGLIAYSADEVLDYYKQLGELNVSPDDGCYPLAPVR